MKLKFQLIFYTELETFKSELLEGTQEQYVSFCEVSKNIYSEKTFSGFCEDGSYFTIPEEVLKNTIIKVCLV